MTRSKMGSGKGKRTRARNPKPRLIIELHCAPCRRTLCVCRNPAWAAKRAMAHVAKTGHIIILNGTVDIPGFRVPNSRRDRATPAVVMEQNDGHC
jgi:hypothetical protein